MTQFSLSVLRSIENGGTVERLGREAVAHAKRVTVTGHVVGGAMIALAPLAAKYAYAHPLVGLAAAAVLMTGTARRGLHRCAGVCVGPKA